MFQSDKSLKEFLLGILVGGSIGALLFKTQQGKKLQKEILSRYHKMSSKAKHLFKREIEKRVSALKTKTKARRRKMAHRRHS